jgi:hypothetical protein
MVKGESIEFKTVARWVFGLFLLFLRLFAYFWKVVGLDVSRVGCLLLFAQV